MIRGEGPPITGLTGELGDIVPRADFVPNEFSKHVDAHGVRVAWERAMRCPCTPVNSQADRPDPQCPWCLAHPGWAYFGPDDYVPHPSVGELDPVQQAIISKHGAAVIRALIIGASRQDDQWTKIGPWVRGEAMITVRPENRLGSRDRIIDLDSKQVYSEVTEVRYAPRASHPQPLRTRYPVLALNKAFGADGTSYRLGTHLRLTDEGTLEWLPRQAPRDKTRVSIHYFCHTVYVVDGQPHTARRSPILNGVERPETPFGTTTDLPIQAAIKLEFLAEQT